MLFEICSDRMLRFVSILLLRSLVSCTEFICTLLSNNKSNAKLVPLRCCKSLANNSHICTFKLAFPNADMHFRYVYNPVDDSTFVIPNLPASPRNLLWDHYPYDKGIFIVYDETTIYTYIFCRENIRGNASIYFK